MLLDSGATLGPVSGRGSRLMTDCFDEGTENEAMFKHLLSKGVDIDMRKWAGHSALNLAVTRGDVERASWLIEHGADLHQTAPGMWSNEPDTMLRTAQTHYAPSE